MRPMPSRLCWHVLVMQAMPCPTQSWLRRAQGHATDERTEIVCPFGLSRVAYPTRKLASVLIAGHISTHTRPHTRPHERVFVLCSLCGVFSIEP